MILIISLTHHFIIKWQKLKSASQLPKNLWFFTKVGWAADCRLISHVFLWILLLYWTPIKHYRTLFYFLALFLLLNNRQIINQVDNPKNLTSNLNKICHGSSPKPRTLSEKKQLKTILIGRKGQVSRFHIQKCWEYFQYPKCTMMNKTTFSLLIEVKMQNFYEKIISYKIFPALEVHRVS